ncbi:MAG: flagellar protein FlaG [Firmicutes bacterium]|jgi:flagellar protein FlaG|nr:flagellar protein FlaG [Bacillota bacterium]
MRVEPNISYRGYEDRPVVQPRDIRIQSLPEQKPRPENSQYSPQEIEKAIGQVNKTIEAFNIGIRFKLHEGAGRFMLQVIDLERNEVIKEIPPQKLLDLAAGIREMIGLLLDEKK